MNNYKQYFNILGIPTSANTDEIKVAYKKLAKIYHPDKSTGNVEKFLQISKAYNALMSKDYVIEDDKPKPCFIPDIFINITVTLKEAFEGKIVKFNGDDNKERTIKIPAGIYSKKVIIEPKKGNTTVSGTVGDIIATVYIERAEGFSFDNGLLVQDVDVDIIKAITGGRMSITGIDGNIIKFDVPQGFQDGFEFLIQEKGWKKIGTDKREDLKIRLHIKNRIIELSDKELNQLRKIGNK